MPAPLKNSFWKLRAKHGRDKIFKSPQMLWRSVCEYFEACDLNPWTEEKILQSGKRRKANLLRAYTLNGLFVFLQINRQTWENYKKQEDFLAIIERVEMIIYDQKLTAAMAGLIKENLVARELGLGDKTAIDVDKMTPEQVDYLFSKHLQNSFSK